jgi:hypothetical protein
MTSTADIDARLASIDETIRRHDEVVGRGPAPLPYGGAAAVVNASWETRPGSASDATPAVLLQTWRPLIFHPDGRVEIGAPRCGPSRSDQLRPPVEIRLTEAMLCGLFDALFEAWDGPA